MKTRIVITLAVLLAVSQALAFHADVFLTQQYGTLITGRGAADPTSGGEPLPGVRFHVNDITGLVPYIDNNPGFSAVKSGDRFFLDDTYQPLPSGRTLGFNLKAFRIQNSPAANLFYWNGVGDVSFQPVINANDYLEVRSGIGSAIATGAAVDVLGFAFTVTDPQGAIHSHLTFDFDVDNNSATPASTGIFLAAFELTMDLTGDAIREASRPHYIAWFNGPPGDLKSNATVLTESFLIDQFAELRLFGDVSPLGENDLPDDLVNAADIDALLAALNSGSTDSLFDLNSDTVINAGDTEILFDILGTQFGDANLDGTVNGDDLALWQENYGTPGGWAAGDFNGDTNVDGRDFLIWQRNFGFGVNLAAKLQSVPEPGSLVILLVGSLSLVCRRTV
jgi:hypothetical protein